MNRMSSKAVAGLYVAAAPSFTPLISRRFCSIHTARSKIRRLLAWSLRCHADFRRSAQPQYRWCPDSSNAGAPYLTNTFQMGISFGGWASFASTHGGRYPLDALGQHLYIDQNLYTTSTTSQPIMDGCAAPLRVHRTPTDLMTEGAWSTGSVPQPVQAANLDVLFKPPA